MRSTPAVGIAVALSLRGGSSWASDNGKGETGGKGGNGPGSTPSPSTAGDIVSTDATSRAAGNPDETSRKLDRSSRGRSARRGKPTAIRQDDLEGYGAQKVFNVFGLYARYDLSEHDRIAVRDFFQQEFIADQGESGLRSGDVTVTYTRTVPLPSSSRSRPPGRSAHRRRTTAEKSA